MNLPKLAVCLSRFLGAVALAAAGVSTANADDAADAAPATPQAPGAYLGMGLGVSKLGPRHEGHDGAPGHRPDAAKLYGGYQLTETWGVEAGWVKVGRVHKDTTAQNGTPLRHHGDAQTLYMAGTGRVALGHGFLLTGKAGVSMGRVRARDAGDADFTLGGHQASPLLGIGAQYQFNRHIALSLDLDGYGKVSNQVKAATATLGLRYGF